MTREVNTDALIYCLYRKYLVSPGRAAGAGPGTEQTAGHEPRPRPPPGLCASPPRYGESQPRAAGESRSTRDHGQEGVPCHLPEQQPGTVTESSGSGVQASGLDPGRPVL